MHSQTITRRRALIAGTYSGVAVFTAGLTSIGARAQPLPKRKSIDTLTPPELENYKHAVGILKQRSTQDPSRQDGYVFQANLHNKPRRHADGSVGACEHGSEQFFPWHRPHLAGFEQLLRASDPPRTAEVTIPYWDWTMRPSGSIFPIAFEDRSSPLFNSGRFTSGDPPMWDGEEIRGMVREPLWEIFAGRPKGPDASYGSFEQGPHNTMHPSIGPVMGNPGTAAQDPIYWSFHAYIDLIWARWQRLHQQIFACGDCTLWLEPNSYKVAQKPTIQEWGYEYDYDFTADGPPVVVAQQTTRESTPLRTEATSERSASAALTAEPARRRFLKIDKVMPLSDASYRINVYLHPRDVNFATLSADQQRRYLVKTVTIWQSAGHHPEASDVLVDISRVPDQAAGNPVVSITTEPVPSGDGLETARSGRAPLPKIESLFRGLSTEVH